ncbi:MAG: hypothetical protein F6K47_30275 [Symploca sp. SIO2E6]|nr:hypothetical protein [Symploca sp. SIO2E6]
MTQYGYALVVGITQYDNSLGSLTKPNKDGESVAQLLERQGAYQVKRLPEGWDSERSCYHLSTERLNGTDLGQALREFLLTQADRQHALIYFSGHGFTISDNLGEKKGYLATSDCTSSTIATRGIPLDSLNKLILESNLSSLVILLDCCHAGSILESNLVRQSLTAFNSSQKDYYLIAACRNFESAWEGEQYSVFTEALLKGLGEDNAGSDGQISCDRLFDSIATALKHSGQEPIRMGWGRSLTLVKYQRRRTKLVIDETCPYQGLEPFGQQQERFFFGRDQVTHLLMKKLDQANFIPIIGASGSGKSSVVRAGLIPELEKNGWQILPPILPGFEPLAELKRIFTQFFERGELREISSLIDKDGLPKLIEYLPGSKPLLLVVDQFEEIFTVVPEEQEEKRHRFIQLLAQVVKISNSQLAIVITLRADFLESCLHYPSLTQIIQSQAVYLPPLEGADLEQAITEPAKLQGYQLEPGLVGEILKDVGKEKNSLPLLQFALKELWERDQKKHKLTLEEYRAMDGVLGALNHQAEDIYHRFSEPEQQWVKRIFLKLIRTGEGFKDTRQRQPKMKLLAIVGDNLQDRLALNDILDTLTSKEVRLLVAGQEENQTKAWVDLAHEALMESWQRFTQWRREGREMRQLIERVEDTLREWQTKPQDENLLMGGLLAQVREKWQELEPELDTAAKEFYQRSDTRETERIAAFRALAEAPLRKQANQVLKLLSTQPTEDLVLAIYLTGISLEEFSGKFPNFILATLRKALEVAREQRIFISNDPAVYSVALSPDGTQVVSGSENGTVRLWNLRGNSSSKILQGHEGAVMSVAFSPDGQQIVSASGDQTLRLWNRRGNPIGEPLQGHEDVVLSVVFSPDSQYIVSTGADGAVQIWNKQGKPIGHSLPVNQSLIYSLSFHRDGQHLIGGSGDGTIQLWNLQDNSVVKSFQAHEDAVLSVAFSPHREQIVSGSWDKTIRLWDLDGKLMGKPFRGHEGAVTSVGFSPNGEYIVSGSWDKTLLLWHLKGNPIYEPCQGHQASVSSVNFSPDGQYIVSGSQDGTVRVWDLRGSLIVDTSNAIQDEDWEYWLKLACLRLRTHPIFTNPSSEVAKAACATCHKYLGTKIDLPCLNCGYVVSKTANYCIRCGYNLKLISLSK